MPNPNDRTTHDGKPIDWRTHTALLRAEMLLGYRLTIVQGIGGAAASGGTHIDGRAVDLTPWDAARKQKVMRQVGFAAWYRPRLVQGGRLVWNPHVHCVLITADKASIATAALNQITDYRQHRSGLVSNRPDTTWHPDPIPVYRWPGSAAALALEVKAAQLLDKPKVPVKTDTGLRVDGIDLSHHNTVTQAGLTAAAKAGVDYAYLKSTEGTTVKDATYPARRAMVRRADMLVGAYHFARPDKDGRDGAAEARAFLAYAKPAAGDMRPVLDLEDSGHLTRAALTRWVGDFTAVVKATVGVLPVVYTPFDLDDNHGCMLWVARYSDSNAAPHVPAPWTRWWMRQFSDGKFGKPNSIAGMRVDLNTLHDGEDLDWLRIPVKPALEPTPAKPAPAKPPVIVKPTPTPVVVKPAPAVKDRTLKIGTWNLQRDRLPATVLHELQQLLKATGLDVLVVQEANDYWAQLAKIPGYQRVGVDHQKGVVEAHESAMVVRDGLTVTDVRIEQVTFDPDGKGPKIAGWYTTKAGGHTPAKYVTIATVEGLPVVAYHTAPSVQSAVLRATHRLQWRSYQESQRTLALLLVGLGRGVVAADWNWDAAKDNGKTPASPKATLNGVGWKRVFSAAGTAGSRSIDGFGIRGCAIDPKTVHVHAPGGSDHRPVTATLTYQA